MIPDGMEARIERLPDLPGCWLWSGSVNPAGYGLYGSARTGDRRAAHRAVYEAVRGPIPDGLTLDHLCRARSCVNPDHLEPVPIAENIQRTPRVVTGLCKRGHPLDGVYRYGARKRYCKTCARRRTTEDRIRSPEAHRARRREVYHQNPEARQAYQRQWRASRIDVLVERQAAARTRAIAEGRIYPQLAHYQRNKAAINARRRAAREWATP